MNDASVRQVVRSKIADGTLPRDRIGAPVPPERVLYRLNRAGSDGLLFHSECFAIWRDERNRLLG